MAESKMPKFLRFASPNERRTISREAVGFYNALIVAAIYEVADESLDIYSAESFMGPLKQCILKHPFLSVTVENKDTEKPFFEAVPSLDLNNHISIILDNQSENDGEIKTIEKILPRILDEPLPTDIPPWRIVILPLASSEPMLKRCFIAFSFSHTLGDGMVGHIFHRTFLEAWEQAAGKESVLVTPPISALTEPFDTPERLPISWGFLLGPLLAVLLPSFIKRLFGLRASTSTINDGTWTARPIFFESSASETTRVRLLEIEASLVQKILQSARSHNSKFTATFHQLIVRALSKVIIDKDITNFVSGTAVNMRGSIGVPASTWGLFVNGHFEVHPRVPIPAQPALSNDEWLAASSLTKRLAECGTRLHDQPIGLLRYAPSIKAWTLAKLGSQRDSSYELSNLLAFDNGSQQTRCKIVKMVFSRPGNVISSPLHFDVISVKGGNLVCSINWQAGALDVPFEEEYRFVDEICSSIRGDLEIMRTN